MTFTFVALRKVGVFGNTVKLGFISCPVKKVKQKLFSHAFSLPHSQLLDVATKSKSGLLPIITKKKEAKLESVGGQRIGGVSVALFFFFTIPPNTGPRRDKGPRLSRR